MTEVLMLCKSFFVEYLSSLMYSTKEGFRVGDILSNQVMFDGYIHWIWFSETFDIEIISKIVTWCALCELASHTSNLFL